MNIPFLQTATFTGLVSTDEYYTSQEWKEAYDDSQVLYTNVQSSSANWNTAYNIATFYSQNSAILIEQTTFAQLTSLKASNQLNPGQLYIITDFELKWISAGLYDPEPYKSSGVIEPLIVQALSSNKLDVEAYSILHPQDIVYYDIDATDSYTWRDGGPRPISPPIPGIKGWITRRVDRVRNIDIGWDWRYIKANCCQFNIMSLPLYDAGTTYNRFDVVRSSNGKIYYSIQGNNLNQGFSTSWWLPVFGDNVIDINEYFPTLERGTSIGAPLFTITPILSTRTQLPTFGITPSQNTTIKSGFNNRITASITNVLIGGSFNNNYMNGTFTNNVLGDGFANNITYGFNTNCVTGIAFSQNIINGWIPNVFPEGVRYTTFKDNISNNIFSHRFFYNTVGNQTSNNVFASFIENNKFDDSFSNNRIGRFFRFNKIGYTFQNNIIDSNFLYNKIGDSFQNNIIEINFTYNTLSDTFTNNQVGSFFTYNDIKNDFVFNTIGTDFQGNVIGNYFINNNIGNIFQFNNIGNDFQNNTTSLNFIQTNIGNEIQNINFAGATHVYNSYDKSIFKNFDSIARLSYFNTNDQLVVTDPTA